MACLYVYVDKEVNIDEVALDLRNQAPTAVLACCCDSDVSRLMQLVLGKEVVDNKTRGHGGKGKGSEARARRRTSK